MMTNQLFKILLTFSLLLFLTNAVLGNTFETTEDSMELSTTDSGEGLSTTDSLSGSDSRDSSSSSGSNSGSDSGSDSNSQDGSSSDGNSGDSGSGSGSNSGSNDDDDSIDDDFVVDVALDNVDELCETDDDDEDRCRRWVTANGDRVCDFNHFDDGCYSVSRRAGVHGSGSFDTGYIAAQNQAQAQADELNTVIGVLAGIIAALAIVMVAGGYYLWKQLKANSSDSVHRAVEMIDNEHTDLNSERLTEETTR